MPRPDTRSRLDERLKALRARYADEIEVPASLDSFKKAQAHPAVRQACEFAGIDPENPAAVAALLIELASARFPAGKPGRPKVWEAAKLCSLFRFYLIERGRDDRASDIALLERVRNRVAHLRKYDADNLRRKLPDALNHNKNYFLKHLLANLEEGGWVGNRRRTPLPDWRTLPGHDDKIKWDTIR